MIGVKKGNTETYTPQLQNKDSEKGLLKAIYFKLTKRLYLINS